MLVPHRRYKVVTAAGLYREFWTKRGAKRMARQLADHGASTRLYSWERQSCRWRYEEAR